MSIDELPERPNTTLHLGMTFEEAADNIGAKVQYTSVSGTIVTVGVIDSVGATSVFVCFGHGRYTGDPVATDPRRLRLLPEREPVQS